MKKAFLKLLVASSLSLAASEVKAQNLITINNSFEQGKIGWNFSGTNTQLINQDGHTGSSSLKLVSKEGSLTYFYTEPKVQKFTLSAGKKYELKMWVKPLTKIREVEIRVYATTGFKAEQDIAETYRNKNLKVNEWQEISIPFTGKDYPEAKFSIAIGVSEVLFDDIMLVEVK
ncbi:carbohydrate binding domain-containing protein [Pedobacter glucosidilyticus]|uniref:carbohydrate binding domain-containing protein n=1 Tax=Pedobacter glucosidilyticus TaxID=1122941 RepID=UPI000408F024|nr:carbohydrate binding domain-containing protein [Pedobacter glucosidilyticus]